MRRSLTLAALLTMTLFIAACGGSEPQQSERPAPPRETGAAPTTQSAPAEGEVAEGEQGNTSGGEETSGLSVTTLQGERVSLEGEGDVTALFFMAGW